MSKTIGKYWYSEVDLDNITVVDEGILKRIAELYSSDYGVWLGTNNKITLSTNLFLELHKHETIYFVSNSNGDIIGFASVWLGQNFKVKVITSMCVKKKYRNQGIGTSMVNYILNSTCDSGEYIVGAITANPILLLILETNPKLEYFDLEDRVSKDLGLGQQLSILINYFRRKSYASRKLDYKRSEKITYKKIDTAFEVYIPKEEILDGLLEFYENLMGTLEPGEEWILFTKYNKE